MFTHDELNLLAMCLWGMHHYIKNGSVPAEAPTANDLNAIDSLLDKVHKQRGR